MQQLTTLLLLVVVFVTTSCGWRLSSTVTMSPPIKKIIFDSTDPNGPFSLAIRNQLRLNKVELIKKDFISKNIPLLRVFNSSLFRDIVFTLCNGRIAKCQILFSGNAEILIPGEGIHTINTKVHQSIFIDNSKITLIKDTEQQIIINEMYNKAAEQLVHKLSNIQLLILKKRSLRTKYSGLLKNRSQYFSREAS